MSRWERLAPLSGIGFVVFLIVSTILFNFYEYLPDPATIQAHLADNDSTIQIAAWLGLVGAFLLAWFAGSIRSAIRGAEGGDGRLSAVAFGGGIVAAAMMAAAYSVMGMSAIRAGADSGITGDLAAFSYDLYGILLSSAAAVGFAVLIGAFTVVTVRKGVLAPWTGWVGGIITIGLLTPFAYLALVVVLLWVIVVSVWAYRGQSAPPPMAGMPRMG
jgi:hypothetical protein